MRATAQSATATSHVRVRPAGRDNFTELIRSRILARTVRWGYFQRYMEAQRKRALLVQLAHFRTSVVPRQLSTVCTECSPGMISAHKNTQCEDCVAGKFTSANNDSDQNSCTACPAGTSSEAVGATVPSVCANCTDGRFADTPGSAVCDVCAPGRWSGQRSTGCTDCIAGMFTGGQQPNGIKAACTWSFSS